MRSINVLHFSDLHIGKKVEKKVNVFTEKIIEDVKKLISAEDINIDFIIFAGDLINSGENGESEFNLAFEKFIVPISKELNIDLENFFFVPGNHEINRKTINETMETGISYSIKSIDDFTNFYNELNNKKANLDYLENKLSDFKNFKDMFNQNNKNLKSSNFFYDTYVLNIDNIKIGLLCLNSAWRSVDDNDAKKLIIGSNIVEEASKDLKECDLKIALSHHGFEMLVDWDNDSLRSTLASNFTLFCNGHIHNSDFEYSQKLLGNLYHSISGSINGKIKNGYSLITIDLNNKALTIYLRKWYPERKSYDQETEKCEDGKLVFKDFSINNAEIMQQIEVFNLRKDLKEDIVNEIIEPIEVGSDYSIEEIFIEPLISKTSTYDKRDGKKVFINLSEIIKQKKNTFFYGIKESGKTILLKDIEYRILKDENIYDNKIPIYIQFPKLPIRNPRNIIKDNIVPYLKGYCECAEKSI